MAFSDNLKDAQAPEATATVDPAEAGKVTNATPKKGSDAGNQFKLNGLKAHSAMTADQQAAEGSKSDKVEFIATLGNPDKRGTRVEGGKQIASMEVVGYRVKLLEDTMIPVAQQKSRQYDDVEDATFVQKKAGDIVDLNIVEAGILISRVEYAGTFSGGNTVVKLGFSVKKDRDDPRPTLNLASATGSIKENMIEIADMIGKDGKNKGVAQVKPEFAEKFSKLFEKKRAAVTLDENGNPIKKAAKKGDSEKVLAAAFRQMYAKKYNI